MSLVEMATAAPQAVARPAAVRALSTLAGAALAVGPVIGFVIQAREVQSTGRLRGFSPGVCLLLLVAHILRIFFWCAPAVARGSPGLLALTGSTRCWLGSVHSTQRAARIFRQFDIALLWQSCLMIAVMLWLLSLCVSAQRQVALEHRVPLRRLRSASPWCSEPVAPRTTADVAPAPPACGALGRLSAERFLALGRLQRLPYRPLRVLHGRVLPVPRRERVRPHRRAGRSPRRPRRRV